MFKGILPLAKVILKKIFENNVDNNEFMIN